MWFETGRVNLWVRKPATLGKAFQLVSNGFFNTGLIFSVRLFEKVLSSVRFKSAHYVFETGQRLPTLTVDLFSASNGVVIKVGDRTHPTSLEVIASYPDWGERSEAALVRLTELIERVWLPARNNQGVERRVDYAV